MSLLKNLCILLFIFPVTTFGQNIEENLQFINEQFDQFNNYETSFDINKADKKIICRDKFGMYSAFLKDIEFKLDDIGENIGIYCHEDSECIS